MILPFLVFCLVTSLISSFKVASVRFRLLAGSDGSKHGFILLDILEKEPRTKVLRKHYLPKEPVYTCSYQ